MQYKARLIGKRYIKKGYAIEFFYEYRGKEYVSYKHLTLPTNREV